MKNAKTNKISRPLWIDKEHHELIHWVIPGLPVTIFHNKFGQDTYDYLDWHWHEELQLCYALKGSICIDVDDCSYIVSEGTSLLINSGYHHRISRNSDDAEYVCINVAVSFPFSNANHDLYLKYNKPFLPPWGKCAYKISKSSEHERAILSSLQQMWECFQTKNLGYELKLYQLILNIWENFFLITQPDEIADEISAQESIRLRKIISFIHREYTNNISLDDIAESVYLSRGECCRFFHKNTGKPLFKYLSEYRIYKSYELLSQTDKKISEIAHEVGFSSQSYFTECFRKQTGITPKEFRSSKTRLHKTLQ